MNFTLLFSLFSCNLSKAVRLNSFNSFIGIKIDGEESIVIFSHLNGVWPVFWSCSLILSGVRGWFLALSTIFPIKETTFVVSDTSISRGVPTIAFTEIIMGIFLSGRLFKFWFIL